MTRRIEIRWKRGTAAGYTDVFPIEEFSQPVTDAERTHLVRGPGGGSCTARYALSVKAREATLNYSAFAAYNKRQDMDVGVMTIRFTDGRRAQVQSVLWNLAPVGNQADVKVVTVKEPSTPGQLASETIKRTARVLLRPEQAAFRSQVERAYGSKCCISGCSVSWAIEAAHIDGYSETLSNSVNNGLLLRRDLHALFDAGHLAIEPKTKRVFLSPEARGWDDYDALHATTVLSAPQPGYGHCAPKIGSLRRRWRRFVQKHGKP